MSTASRIEPILRPLAENVWPAVNGRGVPREWSMTALAGSRYQARQRIGPNRLLADDLWLGAPVLIRKPGLASRLASPRWRRRAIAFVSLRHPNYLNVLEVIQEGGEAFVVTECPTGPSLAELLRAGIAFSLDDVVRILPLTALDVTAALTTCRNGPTVAGMFIELREPGRSFAELVTQPVSQWPPFLVKIDLWTLIQPGADCRDEPRPFARDRALRVMPAVRYAALLVYQLLGGDRLRRGGLTGWRGLRPARSLSQEANALLREVIRGRTGFTSSEEFLWALENANRSSHVAGAKLEGRTISVATPPRHVPVTKRPERSSGKLSWLNSGAVAIAAGLIAAAVVVGAVVYEQWPESHPTRSGAPPSGRVVSKQLDAEVEPEKVDDLGTSGPQRAYGKLSLAADVPETSYEVIGPNSERLTGSTPATLLQLGPGRYTVHLRPAGWPEYTKTVEVFPGQTANVDHAFSDSQNEQAFTMVPFPNVKPVPSAGASVAEENDEDNARVKNRSQARPHRKTVLSKSEAFRRFEVEWNAKEQMIQAQIAMLDRRMASASGLRRERLKAQRSYLERRRDYVRDLRRYHRTQLHRKYGTPASFLDILRNALGF